MRKVILLCIVGIIGMGVLAKPKTPFDPDCTRRVTIAGQTVCLT